MADSAFSLTNETVHSNIQSVRRFARMLCLFDDTSMVVKEVLYSFGKVAACLIAAASTQSAKGLVLLISTFYDCKTWLNIKNLYPISKLLIGGESEGGGLGADRATACIGETLEQSVHKEQGQGDIPTFCTYDEAFSHLNPEGQATLQRLEGMLAQSVAQQVFHMAGVRTDDSAVDNEDGMEVDATPVETGQFDDADVDH